MQDDVMQLLAAIKETADAEKADIRAQTEQEVARIREHTKAQAEQLRDKAFAQLQEQLHTESECILGKAKLAIRDRFVQEQNDAVEEVFERASRRIAAMNDSERKEIFKRLVQEVLARVNRDDVRLRISRADLALWESVKADFPASFSVQLCDGPKGTVVAETHDGSQSIDNSIETRLERARAVMRRELVELLFDGRTAGEAGE
jgi:vacuolar-type H+-ATPase subunit E/Vma4